MTNSHQPEDIAAYNESSLKALVRTVRLSQGQFRLILARCNYGALRDRMVQRLRELSPVEIREIVLPESVKTLYTTIKAALGDEVPQALMVFGLESVNDINAVLKSSNTIREEFSKNFPFPLVLWINDEVLQKLLRIAPDFESWATSVEFKLTTDELLDFLRQTTDEIFASDSTINLEDCFELDAAWQDLQHWGQGLEPDLEARLEFVRGLDDFRCDRIDEALAHYQKSLALPNLELERQGILLLNIARCYYRKAELNRAESRQGWEDSRNYFQQCLDAFEQAQRPDLVAKHISQLGEVLGRLKAWNELKSLAEKALTLHQDYGEARQLAQDYGFLAEVALEQSGWKEANQLTQKALQLLSKIANRKPNDWALHTFLLARSQWHLGQVAEAISNLEQVRQNFNPQYDPQLYIDSLGELRSLYFEQGKYLTAFEIKRERRLIEYQYGFQAFAGASLLAPKQDVINPALTQTNQQAIVVREITASGRERDVKRLLEKISSTQHKLIVIHGQSGVGKSSILQAGLIPVLKQQAIGERDALPVVVRVYTNWFRELGREIAEALEQVERQKFGSDLTPQPPALVGKGESCSPLLAGEGLGERSILEQLQKNADRNLVTVLIFDQFEEFFFVCTDKAERRIFFKFLRECLNIGFVKVILSLREDYLHYLLESEQAINLDAINNNILDKNIRYSLGNFSLQEAKAVIQSLTKQSQFYLQPELIDELVRDLAGELGEVRPIELQVVGAQLQADNITTLEKYHQLGANPQEKLVQRSLEEVVQDCGIENERAARLVLYLLTNENDTRPLKTRDELITDLKIVGFESEVDKLDLVLEVLVGSGLVFEVPESPANRYQLVHDYLVSFIRQSQQAREVAERKKDKEERQRIEVQLNQVLKRRLREAYIAGAGLVTLAAIAGIFGVQSFIGRVNAQINLLSANSEALFASEQDRDALVASLKAGQKLKQTWKFWVNSDTKTQVVVVLQQAIYGVKDIELKTFKGHSDEVCDLAWSPDGKTIASASWDKTIKLWNLEGKELKTFTGLNNWVYSLAWSPDGQTIASGSGDNIKLWNLEGKELKTFTGHTTRVYSLAWSPDGQTIASGSGDNIKLWNREGKLLKTFTGLNDEVYSLAWSPDGQTIASVSRRDNIKLWNREGKLLKTFTRAGFRLAWSPNSQVIASASGDNIKLWNREGKALKTFTGHSTTVSSLAWSPDSQVIASGSADKTIKLWNQEGKLLKTFTGHTDGVSGLAWNPDGQTIASASGDNIKLWNREGKVLKTFTGGASSLAWSPDGQTIASGGWDNTIKLWNREGKLLKTFTGHNNWVYSLAWSPDGQTIASGSWDGTIKLWNREGKLLKTLTGGASSLVWNPDGQTIASASEDNTIKLWNREGKVLKVFKGHTAAVSSLAWSPDGQTIASGSRDNTIKLWNREGKLLKTFTGHTTGVFSLAWSPDGKAIASGSADKTIKLWNLDLENLLVLGCNWLQDYLANNPDTLEALPLCQNKFMLIAAASTLLERGEKLARDGNFEGAVEQFKKAKSWNPELNLNPEVKAAPAFVSQGKDLANKGDIEGAIAQFKKAQQLAPSIDLNPDTAATDNNPEVVALHLEASALVATGEELARKGDIKKAIADYTKAQKLDPNLKISAKSWNNLCWDGSLHGYAKDVIFACEKAVALAPEDGNRQDSRGLARALTGNTKGAIEDFQAFIKSTEDTKKKAQRQRWVDALRTGKNPFTQEELEKLSGQ